MMDQPMAVGEQYVPPYSTPRNVGEHTAALYSDGDRIVMALDAIVNEMRAQTSMLGAIHAVLVRR
jgi:hypothetical protein